MGSVIFILLLAFGALYEKRTIINADIDGKNCFIFFKKGDLYNYLLEHLPEKEQSFVAMR